MISRVRAACATIVGVVRRRGLRGVGQRVLQIGPRTAVRYVLDRSAFSAGRRSTHRTAALEDHQGWVNANDCAWTVAPVQGRAPRIVIVAEMNLPQCRKFRVEQKLELLRARGVQCDAVAHGDLDEALRLMQFASVVIFYRVPLYENFLSLREEAERLGLAVGVDIDDPLFNKHVYRTHRNLEYLSDWLRADLLAAVKTFRATLPLADFFIASTPGMADEFERAKRELKIAHGRPVHLWRNLVDRESEEAAREIRAESMPPGAAGTVTIGFFSGSLAHEADFRAAADGILRLLDEEPSTRLLIGGHLQASQILAGVRERVVHVPFADYPTYLRTIARCDLVVVPLVQDRFNECKSAIRFMDAALLERPVVATRVGDFRHVMVEGRTGWLTENSHWYEALRTALEQRERWPEIGRFAREHVCGSYATGTYRAALEPLYGGSTRQPREEAPA